MGSEEAVHAGSRAPSPGRFRGSIESTGISPPLTLAAYVAALEASQPLLLADLREIMHGFRTVADYRHFEKEDELLVPLLVRHGFGHDLERLDGRREHGTLRHLIDVLEQAAERELNWRLAEAAAHRTRSSPRGRAPAPPGGAAGARAVP